MTDNKKKNIFSAWAGPKARLVVAAVGVVIIIGGILLFWHHSSSEKMVAQGSADVAGSPNIESIPGAGNPSNQYVAEQNLQNQMQAAAARKSGTSSVPTITRPGFIGNPDAFGELPPVTATTPSSDQPALQCPIKKVVVMYKPNPANCSLDNLRLARQAGVTAEELLCQGCSCPVIRDAGYTAGDLKTVGYTVNQLKTCGFTLGQLVQAGFTAADLKAAGYSANDLAKVGFTAGQLLAAGFTPDDVSKAGYSADEIKTAMDNFQNPACDLSALKQAHATGVSASELKAKGCGLAALKAAGYTATELRNAGFSANDLRAAGFSAQDLKNAGYSAADLKAAGFSAADLKAVGFNDADLAAAGFTSEEIKSASSKYCDLANIKKLRDQGMSAIEIKNHGCGLAALKAAGYTAAELKNAGFSAADLKAAGFSAADLKAAGFSAQDLKAAGFSAAELKNAGYSAADLKAAGFNASDLKAAGFSAGDLQAAGFSAAQLRDAGYSAQDLKNAGFTADQLKAAGFSAGELKDAGFSAADLMAAGFSAKQLHEAGFSASDLKAAGFSPQELLAAGYTKGDLLRAGYTPTQAGYAPAVSQVATTAPAAVNSPARPYYAGAQVKHVYYAGPAAGAAMPSIDENTPEAQLAALARIQQQQMSQQQQQDAIAQMQGGMMMQAQKLLGAWSNHSTQTLAQAPVESNGIGVNGAGNGAAGAGSSGPVIKAGNVMFAVLDTAINSDENSPILAHIVTGPLKGAKLLGQFSRVNKKVLISFNLLNDPRFNRSIGISAVAIDPDTARTAVSGDVNNHYLLRYGTLFASSFLQGFSNALLQSGTSQGCFGPFCWTSHSNLNTASQVGVALGNVGEQYAAQMGQNFNVPPTIKIQGGTGIGVLLMNDLTIPTSQN